MNVLWTKIEATLIYQKRYLFFLKGLENTLILTLLSFLFAVLIGLLLCSSKRSPRTAISRAAGIISYALVEIPTLVLLMVFAYIVFAGSDIPIIMIAIIALALKEGAYLSAIFQTAYFRCQQPGGRLSGLMERLVEQQLPECRRD